MTIGVSIENSTTHTHTKKKQTAFHRKQLFLHVKRCCYYLLILKNCRTAIQELPAPTENGFETFLLTQEKNSFETSNDESVVGCSRAFDLVCGCSNGLCDEICSCFCSEQPCKTARVAKQQCHGKIRSKMKCVQTFSL